MNSFTGKITEIRSSGSISLVKVKAGEIIFTSIVIETPDTAPYLATGKNVKVLFKETEVMLAKNLSGTISVQNKIDCEVESFEKDELLCKVKMNAAENKFTSVITRNAFDQLQIQEKEKILALIKTNEVILSPL